MGRRIDYGDGLVYEIVSMSTPGKDNIVIRCDLTPQLTERWRASKCIYLSLRQLLFVEWIDLEQRRQNGKHILGENYGKDTAEKPIKTDVIRCTGVITKSKQFLHTRYFVAHTDFLKQYITRVKV
eukprot:253961_1